MAAPLRRFIVLSAILSALLLPVMANRRPPLVASSKLVQQLCGDKEVDNQRFCLKALSGPKAAAAKTMPALAKVVLDAAAANANATLAVIVGMISKPASASTLMALRECAKTYESAVSSFEIVKSELLDDPLTANYDVGVTRDELLLCQNAIRAGKAVLPRVVIGNRFLENYISMGSAVTNLMPAIKYN